MEFPSGPTANLCWEYLIVSYKHFLAAAIFIEDIQSLPLRSLSATLKNLCPSFGWLEWNFPNSSTSFNLFSIYSLLILTLSKVSLALSTPLSPILIPISSMKTPGIGYISSSLIYTRKELIPSNLPSTNVWAKTMAQFAWQAPFVIQYF